jgi:hypothetical protein
MGKRCNFPILSIGAEYYAIAMLMRRNIMTFKAPERNEGYDLICVNDGIKDGKIARIQVKSRAHYDSDCSFCVDITEKALKENKFDYLILVFQNIAEYGYGKYTGFNEANKGKTNPKELEPEIYTFSVNDLKNQKWISGTTKMRLKKSFVDYAYEYSGMKGIEKIAKYLNVAEVKKV